MAKVLLLDQLFSVALIDKLINQLQHNSRDSPCQMRQKEFARTEAASSVA
jgi:hypothetical protein